MTINYVKGDLIQLAKANTFDVIVHGCNCFCNQERGIAKAFGSEFNTADASKYFLEQQRFKGDMDKLGRIEYRCHTLSEATEKDALKSVIVVNAYTQYKYGTSQINVDYSALTLCMKKLNHRFKGKHIGMPAIGSGYAGGDWQIIERIINQNLQDCTVTVVILPAPETKKPYKEEQNASV